MPFYCIWIFSYSLLTSSRNLGRMQPHYGDLLSLQTNKQAPLCQKSSPFLFQPHISPTTKMPKHRLMPDLQQSTANMHRKWILSPYWFGDDDPLGKVQENVREYCLSWSRANCNTGKTGSWEGSMVWEQGKQAASSRLQQLPRHGWQWGLSVGSSLELVPEKLWCTTTQQIQPISFFMMFKNLHKWRAEIS